MSNSNKGYFGIIRVSSIGQTKGTSLQIQKSKITDYCKLNEINLIGFIEEVESGVKGLERRGITELKQYIEDGIVDGVVFLKYDRLGRNLYESLKMIRYFDNQNITMCSVVDGLNSETVNGRMMINILLSFSEFEKDTICDRLLDGKKKTFNNGQKCGGEICFGYKKNSKGEIVENVDESKVVKYIFKKYIQKVNDGYSKTKLSQIILKGCKRMGFTYRDDKELKSYHIKYFLQNEWYGNVQKYGVDFGKNKHNYKSIISKQLFNKVRNNYIYGY